MKKNIILILLLLIVWSAYFWLNYYWEKSRVESNNKVWFNFNDLTYNDLKTDNFEIKDKKIVYTWTWEYTTDQTKIDNFIWDLKIIKVKSVVSTNKDNFDKFWINDLSPVLKIGIKEIILWNNKWYYGEEYIQIKWIDKVYLIDKDLKKIINKDIEFFRKKEDKKEKTGSWEVTWTWNIK